MKIRLLSFLLIIFVFFSSFKIFVFQKTAYASDGRIDYYDMNFDGENDNYYLWENMIIQHIMGKGLTMST